MPQGTGATTLKLLPSEPYVVDPALFMASTKKNITTFSTLNFPGFGAKINQQLPQVGIISKLRVVFDGTVTVATAAATPSPVWPYGLLDTTFIRANGQSGLIDCRGLDLRALQLARYPAFVDSTDVVPPLTVGSAPIHLTWEYPIAMDEMSLVGSIYAQSASTNLMHQIAIAAASDLFATNPGNVTITGSFSFVETIFEIPFDGNGNLVIPDLSKLHGFNAFDVPNLVTGRNTVPLIRSEGTLVRLFNRVTNGPFNTGAVLGVSPALATSSRLDAVRLRYGANETPYEYSPGSVLQTENNENYGLPLPFNFTCIDMVREYPQRDVIYLQGVTNLRELIDVNTAVAISAGAQTHVVQETLF